MRLLVLALTALAFAQPTFAREHYRHHHSTYGARSYHHLARVPGRHHAWRAAGWRVDSQTARTGIFDRDPAWSDTVSDRSRGFAQRDEGHGQLDAMISRHAQQEGLPEALVHRVVIRESRYKPGVVGAGGAMGLMQIKLATAREMGYAGTAAGLLDPETNLTYAVRYLAGAYRVAGGNADRAVANYARGYRDTTTVREGAASRPWVAPSQNSSWSNSYASAGPIEPVWWVQAPTRHYQYRRSMHSQ
jgi:soluble lytic murein transglycosylase-like protein